MEKRMPAPMPFATVPVAVWEMEKMSVIEPMLASWTRAERAGNTGVEPQARVVEEREEEVPILMNEPPWFPKMLPCTPSPPPKRAPWAN